MSTQAGIGIKQPDGSVRAVYLHFDGYPGLAGAILAGWYRTRKQAEALLALGDLRSIDETLDKVEAYHRDRGESLRPARSFTSMDDYRRNGKARFCADYLYLLDGDRWLVYGLYNDPDWNELNVIIGKENNKTHSMKSKSTKKDPENMFTSAESQMYFCAFRYSLGSRTFIVDNFCKEATLKITRITDKFLLLIDRELSEAIQRDDKEKLSKEKYRFLGDDCQREEWENFLKIVSNEIKRRGLKTINLVFKEEK